MKFRLPPFLHLSALLLSSLSIFAQNASSLPKSYPEAEGVSSQGILRFIEAAEKSKNELHSFIFMRHGKVIAEGWWNPYKPSLRQSLYSTSKTFTSTAIGLAVAENKIRLTDKVISFFPSQLPDTVSANLSGLTVKDLLTMADGMDPDPTMRIGSTARDWVKGFLATPVVYKPGTVFLYNSMGSFMLSAIVQKATGQQMITYLKSRLFEPLGITGEDWEENLMSINTGGWGLRLKTEDMAKVGQLYLQKGNWNGKQILPASWIAEATSAQIIQHPSLPQIKKDSSDWEQGYGYQIWRSRHHSYRADGAFGQYILVFPDLDAVIAIQSETPDMQDELNLVWETLLPAMKTGKLPSNELALVKLNQKLSSLTLPTNAGSASSYGANGNIDRSFILDPNENHFESLNVQIQDSVCHFVIRMANDVFNLKFGAGRWLNGQTNKPVQSLFSYAKENYALLLPYKVAGNFYWKDEQTLVMQLRYIETPHMETFTLHMEGKKLIMESEASLHFGKKKQEITGVLK